MPSGLTLQIDVDYIAVCDPNYGADSDGNRGIECWSLSDIVVDIYDRDTNITKIFAITDPKGYEEILSDAADRALDDAANKGLNHYKDED